MYTSVCYSYSLKCENCASGFTTDVIKTPLLKDQIPKKGGVGESFSVPWRHKKELNLHTHCSSLSLLVFTIPHALKLLFTCLK